MHNVAEILRKNPQIAGDIGTVRQVIEDVRSMRDAGFANGPDFKHPAKDRRSLHEIKASFMRKVHSSES